RGSVGRVLHRRTQTGGGELSELEGLGQAGEGVVRFGCVGGADEHSISARLRRAKKQRDWTSFTAGVGQGQGGAIFVANDEQHFRVWNECFHRYRQLRRDGSPLQGQAINHRLPERHISRSGLGEFTTGDGNFPCEKGFGGVKPKASDLQMSAW